MLVGWILLGKVLEPFLRSRKTRSVHRSLQADGAPASDQGEVWDDIAKLQVKAGAPSPTTAMSDVFKAREDDLRQCEQVFRPVPNQVGLLAVIDGKAAGLDLVSLSAAYAKLHPKLVRSYALESLLEPKRKPVTRKAALERSKAFLDDVLGAETSRFPSVGYGIDFRFQARNLAGTALIHVNEVIHAAFFRLDEQEPRGKLASLRNRRRHYRE